MHIDSTIITSKNEIDFPNLRILLSKGISYYTFYLLVIFCPPSTLFKSIFCNSYSSSLLPEWKIELRHDSINNPSAFFCYQKTVFFNYSWAPFSNFFFLNIHTTDSTKINRPGHNIRMYWTNFWQPTAHVQQNIFGETLIEVCLRHLYASFGTFCIQIRATVSL